LHQLLEAGILPKCKKIETAPNDFLLELNDSTLKVPNVP
jgi:hypothetical protein